MCPPVVVSYLILYLSRLLLEPDPVPVALLGRVEGHLLAAHRDDLAGRALQRLGARIPERGHLRIQEQRL